MHQAAKVMAAAAVMSLAWGSVMNDGGSRAERWQAPQRSDSSPASPDNLMTQRQWMIWLAWSAKLARKHSVTT